MLLDSRNKETNDYANVHRPKLILILTAAAAAAAAAGGAERRLRLGATNAQRVETTQRETAASDH